MGWIQPIDVMKAATERKIIRWFHILASIPIIGYIYGPVASFPEPAFAVRFVIFPAVGFLAVARSPGPQVVAHGIVTHVTWCIQ